MTKIVGILNVTTDSFSDGGKFIKPERALNHARELFAAGADFVDIGAESTRPGAIPLTDEEEWQRLESILPTLITSFQGKIMLDSHHPVTIRRAALLGPIIVNDVTGLTNPDMFKAICDVQPLKVVVSQLPQAAHASTALAHEQTGISDVEVVRNDLIAMAKRLELAGFSREDIILDPGIGFGKTMELNKELLTFAELLPQFQVMIGYSRKRFLGDNRMELAPNIAAGQIAIESGASYLRVHDVSGHRAIL